MKVLGPFALYVFICYCLKTVADKTGTRDSWLAWIPIINWVLVLRIARRPLWWILLMLIPILNIVIGVILAMTICERRGKPAWLGLLMLLPLINLIVLGYVAFSD